jgi:hypothetical protein
MTGDRLYQCGGSGMFIPDPDFTHTGSRIPDPKTAMKRSYTEHSFVGSGLNILDPKQCDWANNFDSKSIFHIYICPYSSGWSAEGSRKGGTSQRSTGSVQPATQSFQQWGRIINFILEPKYVSCEFNDLTHLI